MLSYISYLASRVYIIMEISFIFSLIILLFSVVIHEVSHGYAALFLGDKTAEYEGRLTLNPIKHMDLMGTVILPAVSLMLGGFLFGWAKPVPFNPYNLRNRKWGEAIVAGAGPLSNIALALIFGGALRFLPIDIVLGPIGQLCAIIAMTNITLAVFNLMPVPPLDGSKLLTALMPARYMDIRLRIERFGFLGVIIFLIFIWQFFSPVIPWLFKIITGVA